jgi:hypothetical protein
MLTEDDLLTLELANIADDISRDQVRSLIDEVKRLWEMIDRIGPDLLTDDE